MFLLSLESGYLMLAWSMTTGDYHACRYNLKIDMPYKVLNNFCPSLNSQEIHIFKDIHSLLCGSTLPGGVIGRVKGELHHCITLQLSLTLCKPIYK